MHDANIRNATFKDASALLSIYTPFIEGSAVSFETISPTQSEFEKRIKETLISYPWLVYEKDNSILGYAYAGPHRSRCAYGWSADVTVYVSPKAQRQRIGHTLYEELFRILKKQGIVNLFAGIALPNEASIGLHKSLGFNHIGIYRNVGFKLNQWWDVSWWQLHLQSPDRPRDITLYSNLEDKDS